MVSPMSDPARHPDDSGPADAAKRHCRNCGAVPGSRYCGECGEPTYRGPLTAAQLAARLWQGVVDLDRGFLHTVRQLTIRPAAAVGDYLEGRSSRYTNPLRYLVVSAALTTLGMLATGAFEHFGEMETTLPSDAPEEARRFIVGLELLMTRYFNLLTIAAVPLMAVATALFFRPARRTFPEHLVLNAYTYAHASLLFTALTVSLSWALPVALLQTLLVLAWFGYWTWAAVRFFDVGIFSGGVRAVTAGTLATLVYWVIMMAGLLAWVLLTSG
jgi:hypothetical protein